MCDLLLVRSSPLSLTLYGVVRGYAISLTSSYSILLPHKQIAVSFHLPIDKFNDFLCNWFAHPLCPECFPDFVELIRFLRSVFRSKGPLLCSTLRAELLPETSNFLPILLSLIFIIWRSQRALKLCAGCLLCQGRASGSPALNLLLLREAAEFRCLDLCTDIISGKHWA